MKPIKEQSANELIETIEAGKVPPEQVARTLATATEAPTAEAPPPAPPPVVEAPEAPPVLYGGTCINTGEARPVPTGALYTVKAHDARGLPIKGEPPLPKMTHEEAINKCDDMNKSAGDGTWFGVVVAE